MATIQQISSINDFVENSSKQTILVEDNDNFYQKTIVKDYEKAEFKAQFIKPCSYGKLANLLGTTSESLEERIPYVSHVTLRLAEVKITLDPNNHSYNVGFTYLVDTKNEKNIKFHTSTDFHPTQEQYDKAFPCIDNLDGFNPL